MIGRTVSHYIILEQIGAGGMGVVYRAHDQKLKRDVALKVLPPRTLADDSARSRFKREALALSKLNHPNICTIYEIGEGDSHTYIVMEYVDGRPLDKLIPSGGLAIETSIQYGTQIADALAHAHGQELLHRDIKSSNVMVTKHGRVKLLDFGLVKRVEPGPSDETLTQDSLTQEGTVLGTVAYMAPEVLRGGQADARSELWALGVVLHEMLAGARPFQGKSNFELSSAILREPPTPLPERTPARVGGIVRKCLAKEPEQRYQSAVEVRAALEAVSPDSPVTTPRTPVAYRWLILAAALAILAVWLGPRLKSWSSGSPGRIDSVAVLPFENLSNDPEQEFFADGMTEQLITDLSKIRALRVISRTSAMRYRGKQKKPLPQIAEELGVEAVVEGSVMRSADKIRITAQLIQARGDQHLWAESYDRDLREVLGLQREVARTIAEQIRVTITIAERGQLTSGRPLDPEVHELVLRGMYFANKFGETNLNKAVGYFEQAIAKDPNYAPAHSGLAQVYLALSGNRPPREVMPKAKVESERALQLDEAMAGAHVALAQVLLYYDWDWPAAEKHLKRAVELNPSNADAHLTYGSYFNALGRPQEALAEIRLAQALDPLSLPVQAQLLFSMLGARQFDEVIEQSHRVLEREPNFSPAYVSAALAYTEKGQFEQAVEAIEKAAKNRTDPTIKAIAAHVYGAKGNRSKAEKLLAELKALSRRRYVCAYEVAHAHLKLGNKKQAYEWLEKGKRERADCMVWLLNEPWMDPLRGDLQYRELIEHIGLSTGKAGQKP